MRALLIIMLIVVALVFGLQSWRWSDNRRVARVWDDLTRKAQLPASVFDASMVAELPEPARRYFLFTIKPGTPIRAVAEIYMGGELGLGTKDDPRYAPMRAEQILAPPHGLVWKLTTGRGLMRISGSDSFDGQSSWVRFWLMNTLPIVRVGGTRDHARAAFGRVVAESVFWTPAMLLPGHGVTWDAVSVDVARATVTFDGISQTVEVTVAEDGRPTMVVMPRWSDANPQKSYQLQPFGGYLSEFREFDGYRLATRVEGGNFIGTDDYFPFYKARVTDLRFVNPKLMLDSQGDVSG